MAKLTNVTIVYRDGRSEEVPLLPIGMVMAERHFKGAMPGYEGTCYATWAILKPDLGFDEWLESLADLTSEEADTLPLPEEPPPAS